MTSKEWKEVRYGMALLGFGFFSGAFLTGALFKLIELGSITERFITERNLVWMFMAGVAVGLIVMLLSCAYVDSQSELETIGRGERK